MSENSGLNRRSFLKSAGLTAVAGAVGTGNSLIAAGVDPGDEPADGQYDFDTVYDRIGTDCVKWDSAIARYGAENIEVPMGIADMDFRAAPCITRALAERLKHENWGYMSMPKTYVETIVNWNKTRYGLEIDPDTISFSDGVHPALIAALKAFSAPGSKVLLMTPGYSGFYSDLRASDTIGEDSPMSVTDGRYAFDFDDLESRIDNDTNALILCNPQNPTGNCWSSEVLMRMGQLCLERRIVVLSDEIHCDFAMKDQAYTPFAKLPDKDVVDNSITFKAASKTFSLAAMKNAWFFSTNPDYLARVRHLNRANTNSLGAIANIAALSEGEAWLDQALTYIDLNHDLVESYVRDNVPLLKYTKAQGTYLAWVDVSALAERIGAAETAEDASKTAPRPVSAEMVVGDWLVEHAKVQLNAGHSYGAGGEGHMRMNIAVSRQLVQKALDNMAEATSTL